MYVAVWVFVSVCDHVSVCVCVHAYVSVIMYLFMCVYICVCIHVCMCVCVCFPLYFTLNFLYGDSNKYIKSNGDNIIYFPFFTLQFSFVGIE